MATIMGQSPTERECDNFRQGHKVHLYSHIAPNLFAPFAPGHNHTRRCRDKVIAVKFHRTYAIQIKIAGMYPRSISVEGDIVSWTHNFFRLSTSGFQTNSWILVPILKWHVTAGHNISHNGVANGTTFYIAPNITARSLAKRHGTAKQFRRCRASTTRQGTRSFTVPLETTQKPSFTAQRRHGTNQASRHAARVLKSARNT